MSDEATRQQVADQFFAFLRGTPLPEHVVNDPVEARRAATAVLSHADYQPPPPPEKKPGPSERIAIELEKQNKAQKKQNAMMRALLEKNGITVPDDDAAE